MWLQGKWPLGRLNRNRVPEWRLFQVVIQYNFRGKFEKGYKTEGLMVFKHQGSYDGSFYNEQFHGKGVLRLKDKSISAEWINGIV